MRARSVTVACAGLSGVVLSAFLVVGCRPRAALPSAPATTEHARLHVLALNGGGTPAQNYQSHLLHVQQLHAMMERLGVAPERMTVLASDGADPGLDLATRDVQPEADFWLLEGSRLEAPLRTPVVLANSVLAGTSLRPATRPELRRWFGERASALRPGDTLLLYVTDHGTRAPAPGDRLDTAITLWGKDEKLTVRELAGLLRALPAGVRVVAVMSQCYSGGFAALAQPSPDALPDGSICGFFSSTHDRPAYGCYPENRGRDNVGHSFHFLDALARSGDLLEAHRETLVHDATPDVPLRTSDVWLGDVVARIAGPNGDERIDALLREAWRDPARWEPELRLLDRIGQAYGFASPRSLAELRRQLETLDAVTEQLRTHHQAWERAFDAARRANLEGFLRRVPTWRSRLSESALQGLSQPAARHLTDELLADLLGFTRAEQPMFERLGLLRTRTDTARALAYRMEVRRAVLERMRSILVGVAGRSWVARSGTAAQQDALAALERCEALRLPPPGVPPGAELARPEPFPSLERDLAAATEVLPAWLGIQFRPLDDRQRARAGLDAGAARVVTVYPDSPAAAAGLRPGDIVLGPPGTPFRESDQIREWTMLSPVGEPRALEVLREERPLRLSVVLAPMPARWPTLPGPPQPGTIAPSLQLDRYRGHPPATLAAGRSHLLFFFATWCGVCKAALPELDAFARERATPVVAISDEPREQLDRFFERFTGAFPAIVATDPDRRTFSAFGVNGIPTFVLVDGEGRVRSTATGYTAARGLAIEGWTWSQRPAGASASARPGG